MNEQIIMIKFGVTDGVTKRLWSPFVETLLENRLSTSIIGVFLHRLSRVVVARCH